MPGRVRTSDGQQDQAMADRQQAESLVNRD